MLYGRAVECAAVDTVLAGVRAGRSGVVVIRGEPGVGKSTLLGYITEQARDMRWLRCVGVESEVELAFAALHQLLRPVMDRVDALPAPQAAALRGAFGLGPGRGEDRFLVAIAVLTLLGEVAGEDGLVCLVDDAQWLDRPSAEALVFAARRLEAEGVALVFAARDGDVREFDAAGLPQLRLDGLEPAAADALLAACVPAAEPQVRDRLVRSTAGNPLALIELQSALTPGQFAGREPLPDPLPLGGGVERVFAQQVRGLPAATQRLLVVAAADDTAELTTILRAAAVFGAGLEALETAERHSLVSVREGRLEFRHPLVRSAVYQQATFAGRRAAHEALATVLDREEDADRRAWHRASAAVGPEAEVADALERAADRANQRGGPAAAAAALERSAALTGSDRQRGHRLLAAAEAAWHAGQHERSSELLNGAEPLISEPARHARIQYLRGWIELRSGVPDVAYQLLRASAQSAATDEHTAVEALVLASEVAGMTGNPAQAQEVEQLAEQRFTDARANPLVMVARAMCSPIAAGDWTRGAPMLRQVIDGCGGSADPQSLLLAGRAAHLLGNMDTARHLYGRAATTARTTGAVDLLTGALAHLAYLEVEAGRFADAEAYASEDLRLAPHVFPDAAVALAVLAKIAAVRGNEDSCRDHADRAHTVSIPRGLRLVGAAAVWARGLLDLGLGRPAAALARLATMRDGGDSDHPVVRLGSSADLVEAAVRSGQPEACRPALAEYEGWAAVSGQPRAHALLARCHGLLADGHEAIGHFEAALHYHGQVSWPFERARTQLLYGETLRRARQRSRARGQLRAALEGFDRLGAVPWSERARGELRASGETARRRDPSTVGQLTPQERQIALFASQGASNPDIAAQLFLSRRTVEYHLRKVFTKLGVTSRSQLILLSLEAQ